MAAKKKRVRKFVKAMKTVGDALENVPELYGKSPKACVVIIGCEDGHTHILKPEDINIAKNLLNDALEDLNYLPKAPIPVTSEVKLPKRIVFHNRQAIGDILMFTAGIRDFKAEFPGIEVQVRSTALHLWDYNPHIKSRCWSSINRL
jgi:hypothetical protein